MRIIINTDKKEVKIESTHNLSEIVDSMMKMFPDDWREYKLIPHMIATTTQANPLPYGKSITQQLY